MAKKISKNSYIFYYNIPETDKKKYSLAIEAITDGLWDWNIQTGEINYNPACIDILEMENVPLNYKAWESRLHPEDKERITNLLESYFKGEADCWKFEHRLLIKSGNYKWVLIHGKVVERDKDGKPLRMIGTMTDINRIKLFEGSLKEYEKTIENLEDVVTVMDKNHTFRMVNQAFLKKNKKKREDVIGHPMSEILGSKAYNDTIKKHLDRAFKGEVIEYEMEYEYPEIGRRLLKVVYNPIKDQFNKVERVAGIIRDITEHRESELRVNKALEEAQKKARETAALLKCTKVILEESNFEKIAHVILDTCCSLIGTQSGYIILKGKDEKEKDFVFYKSKRLNDANDLYLPMLVHGPGIEVYKTGKAVFIDNFIQSEWRNKSDHVKLKNVLISPIKFGRRKAGLMVLVNKPDGLTAEDAQLAEAFGELAAISLKNSYTQRALEESEEKFSKSFMIGPDSIIITRMDDGKFLEVNEQYLKKRGYSREEIIGKNVNEIQTWVNREERNVFIQKLKEQGHIENMEAYFLKKDGTILPCLISASAIDIMGEKCIISIARDISDRIKMEEEIKKERDKATSYLQIAASFIMALDTEGNITLINDSGKKILECEKKDIIGKNWFDAFMPEAGRYEIKHLFYSIMAGNIEHLEHYENWIVTAKGRERLMRWHNGLIRDEKGRITGSLSSGEDITEYKTLQDYLHHTEKMQIIGQMAGGIAHDFNNILGAIIGYTELTLGDLHEESNEAYNLKQILKACDRSKRLVNQILTFSHKGSQVLKPIHLKPVVKEVIQLLQASLPESIEIITELNKDTKPIIGDATKIHEVVMNLCTNAAYAMENKGRLSINLKEIGLKEKQNGLMGQIEPGEYSVLEIKDSGCGMDKETLSRIFEPFFTTRRQQGGTGMGLSVVYGIVQSHNGNIIVESWPQSGTAFHLYFPKIDAEVDQDTDEEQEIQKGHEKILFIDDEEILVDIATEILVSLGYKVKATTSCSEAIDLFRNNPQAYDLIITDQIMPKMNGLELAKEMMNIRKDIPIILSTGYYEEYNSKRIEEYGIKALCLKPLTKKELSKTIRTVLKRSNSFTPPP